VTQPSVPWSLALTVPARSLALQIATYVALAIVMYALLVCAWQCDDAYITFRTVRNFWSGWGLTWNPDERVQAYTHPLWMFVGLAVYGVAHEMFFSMTAVAVVLSLATVILLRRICANPLEYIVTIVILTGSCAFIEFSVCGLENPLLNLILVASVVASRASPSPRSELARALCLSGVFLTRADAVLLIGPLWAAQTFERRGQLRFSLLGLAPIAVWEVFSLVYYGSLTPNTALAKLNIDIPLTQLALEGVRYLGLSSLRDPVTLIVLIAASTFALLHGGRYERLLVAGTGLYLLYVVRIGGDFMAGRFLGAPLLVAVSAANGVDECGQWPGRQRISAALVVVALAYAFIWPHSPMRSTLDYGKTLHYEKVNDERAYYYQAMGLLPTLVRYPELKAANVPVPWGTFAAIGLAFSKSPQRVMVRTEAGILGYYSGEKIVIDMPALADPLLARIKFRLGADADGFRAGHYERWLPDGYLESRALDRNLIERPDLREAYDAIRLMVRGPLFTLPRWRAIWRLNTGYYDAAFERAVPERSS
jgi:arabinofuranosyltransferase